MFTGSFSSAAMVIVALRSPVLRRDDAGKFCFVVFKSREDGRVFGIASAFWWRLAEMIGSENESLEVQLRASFGMTRDR